MFIVQEKIGDFFEKSDLDKCLLRFEQLNFEIDKVRLELYTVQQSIIEFKEKFFYWEFLAMAEVKNLY